MTEIQLLVNGGSHTFLIDARTTLLALLREQLHLTGAKPACDRGECGACTVLLDDQPFNACHLLAVQAAGKKIVTVEGLAGRPEFEALVRSFVAGDGGQCGYCTPGFAVAAYALLRDDRALPGEDGTLNAVQIRWALVGHICRCNAYDRIVESVQSAAAGLRSP